MSDKSITVIANSPTPEMYQSGMEIDCQCARCGSSIDVEHCEHCGGDGVDGHECGEDTCCCLYPHDNVPCEFCGGTGAWRRCLSSPEWCRANPIPGREHIERGAVEWFTFSREP